MKLFELFIACPGIPFHRRGRLGKARGRIGSKVIEVYAIRV